MCGITGVYNYSDNRPVNEELLKEMASVLEHRGPDGDGYYIHGSIGLGHKRLSIIDIEGGGQPIFNESKDVCVILNGEIYNFPDLKEELAAKGHVFYTNTDTEVIVHLYEEMGELCVEKLKGMFAFALWDEKRKKLLIARDRVGKKPLYYFDDGKRIVFASELKSLIVDRTIPREIMPEALVDYFVYLCVISPKTIFKNIHKLCPGNYLTCTSNGSKIREYWDLPMTTSYDYSEDQYVERLGNLLKSAVRYRLISDVPLGAFLSGGIDSSTIVCLMSELKKEAPVTASIRFREKRFDESSYARTVAKYFSTQHHEEVVESNAVDKLKDIIWYLDEPFADASAIPTFNLSRVARKHVKVALSGDGGDEIFAGYRRYFYDMLENRVRRYIPAMIRYSFIRYISEIYPKAAWIPQILRAKTFLQNISSSQGISHFNSVSAFNDEERSGILNSDMLRELNGYHPFSIMEHYYKRTENMDELSKILYVDFKTYLPDRMLVKVDRMSMAHSLEVRSPLLDQDLIEYVAMIPSSFKLRGRQGKYILKQCMRSKLPNEIIYRTKKGFDIPLDIWFRNDIKNMACETLFQRDGFLKAYLDHSFIEKMWDEHQKGTVNWGQHLWSLFVLELWSDTILKQ